MFKSITSIFLAFSTFFSAFFTQLERIPENRYNSDITFQTISNEEIEISDKEKQMCRDWFDKNLRLEYDDYDLPYDFKAGGKSLRKNLEYWDITVSEESKTGAVHSGGKTSYITFTHKLSSLKATVEATIYEDNATCEWTVYIANNGNEDSPVIADFYAADTSLQLKNAELYYSKGSFDEPYDFALMNNKLSLFPASFTSKDGRSTDTYLSYFNVSGKNSGIVLGVGWTGLWKAEFSKIASEVSFKVKQEKFKAYLLPEEEVRSPLVSLCFYDNSNPLKGFNTFRNWISNCVYPENIPDTMTMLEFSGPAHTQTAEELYASANHYGEEVYGKIDCFWMDAGWYKYNEGWHDSVGSWIANHQRFPNGIGEVSDFAAAKGCGLVLWFEPERVCPESLFHIIGRENDKWLIEVEDNDNMMWNLANDAATDYLIGYISDFIKDNRISVYRQDFNFSPDIYWKQADKEFYGGRKGITENHYVSNLYRYLDGLCENVEGLIIDNCASGGRRLDLEMTRRSIPVWRSDYNCNPHEDILEATQFQTFGLSFWLPISGTVAYSESEYAARSSIMPMSLETFGTIHGEHYGEYINQRSMMRECYYPLSSGSYYSDRILAMQYSDYSADSGMALIYKRADVKETVYMLKLNGLSDETVYSVYDYDSPEKVFEITGKELMSDGIRLDLPEGEKAFIIMFSAKG